MKTRESTKAASAEPAWYASATRPAPGELTKVPPAELAGTEPAGPAAAESEESADSIKNKARQRLFAGLYAAIAAFGLLMGDDLNAMFWVSFALCAALEGETRWRVPKLVKVCAFILMMALCIMMVVKLNLKVGGR